MMVRRGGEYYCAIFLVSNQINFRFFIFSRQAVVHGLYIRKREKAWVYLFMQLLE
jgi:hypothetical protein